MFSPCTNTFSPSLIIDGIITYKTSKELDVVEAQ